MTILEMALVGAMVYPHVSNKLKLVKTIAITAAYIRDNLPPGAPVAVYAIGQLAFESRHPLVDIGGITRPGVLRYVGDLPATIRWAKGQGAQYYIAGDPPAPAAVPVFSYSIPFLGWTLDRSNYSTSIQTGIYRLP
jgi:hypothetical protein